MGDIKKQENIDPCKNRSELYTELLSDFVNKMYKSATAKNRMKKIFFYVILVLLVVLFIAFLVCACFLVFYVPNRNAPLDNIASIITSLLSLFSTLLVALIKLPKIIAKYLFNPKEDRDTVAIIGKIQKYDIHMNIIKNDREQYLMKKQMVEVSDAILSENNIDTSQEPSDKLTPDDIIIEKELST